MDHQFTGKERDSESGLDYFGARYYGSGLGRFTSPDWSAAPEPVPYADFSNPQTLNQYAYVLNNPLAHPDADGHCGLNFACWTEVAEAAEPLITKGQAVIGGALVAGSALAAKYGDQIKQEAKDILAAGGGQDGQYGDFSRQLKFDDNKPMQAEISKQKQDAHNPGTKENERSVDQGKPTSTFNDAKEGEALTQDTHATGTPVPGRADQKVKEYGKPVGTGAYGGKQTQVRVHEDQKGGIHGHPDGPEQP